MLPTLLLPAFLLLLPLAPPDELLLKNGDRITGTIVSMSDEKLVVDTESAGRLTIDWTAVQTLQSSAPVTLLLRDGTSTKRTLARSDPETVRLEGEGVVLPAVPLVDIAKINPPPVRWEGNLAVGATKTSGNSDTLSVTATFDAVRRSDIDRFTLNSGWFFSEQEDPDTGMDVITERRVFGALKYDYFISKKWYLTANTRAEGSEAQDLELRFTAGVGIGHQFVERDDLKVSGEVGVGYFYEKFDNVEADSFISGRVANNVDWTIVEGFSYAHLIEWFPGFEDRADQLVHYDGKLQATLTESMFAQFQTIWDWDNTPAPGFGRVDVKYILSIGWKF
jgi:putative salt-induced outer membrane protein YdiY